MHKTAIITGAAKRIGKATAIALAQNGYNIALHYNNSEQEVLETKKTIKDIGVDVEIFQSDFSKPENIDILFKQITQRFKKISVLINNASIFNKRRFLETDREFLQKNLNVNFISHFILSQKFLSYAQENLTREDNINIINILDTYIKRNTGAYFAYLLSKKTFSSFNNMLAIEAAPLIRVNAISPGITELSQDQTARFLKQRTEKLPIPERAKIKDITKTVIQIIENTAMIGQNIAIDSGEQLL